MDTTTETVREWLPASWLDEITPELQPTPETFIEAHGKTWLLTPPVGSGYRDEAWLIGAIEPGQIIPFVYRELYGTVMVTVQEDGTWAADRTWPDKTSHFWRDGEIFDSMQQAVKPDGDWMGDPLPPGEHPVEVGFWSETISFRFDVSADGKPVLAQVAGAN